MQFLYTFTSMVLLARNVREVKAVSNEDVHTYRSTCNAIKIALLPFICHMYIVFVFDYIPVFLPFITRCFHFAFWQ